MLPVQWYFEFWFSATHLLLATLKSPTVAAPHILSVLYSHIQWETQGGVRILHFLMNLRAVSANLPAFRPPRTVFHRFSCFSSGEISSLPFMVPYNLSFLNSFLSHSLAFGFPPNLLISLLRCSAHILELLPPSIWIL